MKYLKSKKFLIISLLAVIDGLFFSLTNPQTVKAIFLVVGFGLAVITIYYLCQGLISLLSWYGLKVIHKKRFSLALTGFLGVILALLSFGQLSLKEVLIVTPFFLLLYIYLSYDRLPD